jgi:hypothetical protein
MTNETDTELAAQAAAEADQQAMREVCAASIVGLKPHVKVYRTTTDLLRMGYPVQNQAKEYTEVSVADLKAFLSQ